MNNTKVKKRPYITPEKCPKISVENKNVLIVFHNNKSLWCYHRMQGRLLKEYHDAIH